jgi:hypothetical protein
MMNLQQIKPGSWGFHVTDPLTGAPLKILLYGRDQNGSSSPEPSKELLAVATNTAENACRIRDGYIDRICDPDFLVGREATEFRSPGFTDEELMNRDDSVMHRMREQTKLVHIAVEQYPGGSIDIRGYVTDPWGRVWELGDDYIDGYFSPADFTDPI